MDFNKLVTLHIKILNQILRFKKMTISHFYKTCVSVQNTNLDLHHFNFFILNIALIYQYLYNNNPCVHFKIEDFFSWIFIQNIFSSYNLG